MGSFRITLLALAGLTLFCLFAFSYNMRTKERMLSKWVVMKGGSLRVDGSTNINKFNCDISNYARPDTILISRNSTNSVLSLNGAIKLDVQNFDCHNPVMTSDLRKTLKAKQFPLLTIRFLSLSRYPDTENKPENIRGSVNIELAGVTRRFDVDYKVLAGSDDVINLIGIRKVNFTDFNITPPRKIGGMIQTDNELNVMFTLRLKMVD